MFSRLRLRVGELLERHSVWSSVRRLLTIALLGAMMALWSALLGRRSVSLLGAATGLIAADCIFLAKNWQLVSNNRREAAGFVLIAAVNIHYNYESGISVYAHSISLLGGLFLGAAMPAYFEKRPMSIARAVAWFVCGGLALLCPQLIWARMTTPVAAAAGLPCCA
jgi:hypothetical protein